MATQITATGGRRGTGKYEELLARCQGMDAIPTAVTHPCDDVSLGAALEAARMDGPEGDENGL